MNVLDFWDISVLIVEDEPVVALDLEGQLRAQGLGRIVHAADLEEADAAITQSPFGLALVNWRLGDGDTGEIIDRLLAAGTEVVLCSGSETPDRYDRLERLEKPFRPNTLEALINRIRSRAVGRGAV